MRLPLFVAFALPFIACSGNSPKAQNPSTDPSSTPTSAVAADAGPTTTTTLTLPDGGDLQGTKLVTKTQTLIQDPRDAGPPPGPSHEPGRTVEDIMAIIQTRRPEARACYDAALNTHPGIEGKVDITWKIDVKGVVTDVGVNAAKSDIHEPTVIDCISKIIRAIKFAESQKGFETSMHYPFDFHPHARTTPRPPG